MKVNRKDYTNIYWPEDKASVYVSGISQRAFQIGCSVLFIAISAALFLAAIYWSK